MDKPSTFERSAHTPVPLWRDIRVIQIVAQVIFVIVVVGFGYLLIHNLLNNLQASKLAVNYHTLERPFGTKISEGQSALSETDQSDFSSSDISHIEALFQGFKNTLRVVIVGLVGATLLGLLVGIGRLTPNFLLRHLANGYIELFRNTPLLIQLYFIYRGLRLILPETVRESVKLPGPIYINVRAVNFPLIQGTDSVWWFYAAAGFGLVCASALWMWRLRVQEKTGQPARTLRWSLPVLLLCAAVGWLLAGKPFSIQDPVFERFNFVGGDRLSSEYIALTIGLVLYTAAFIADIVRAGIQAVPHGQIEAARAQGFTGAQTLRLIVLPQALRLIIPPLGNQYLNLAKNSSLGIAIGFLDVYNVANLVQNQTSQPVVAFSVMMLIYLGLSLVISAIMNLVNYRMRLRTR
ncbi:MAG TPA: ABC transporter permease subunit [Aggregatilineaceae bacterium]|nr:ABC transporter permease subunit [Aggregatilineaceae bacterium]